MGRSEIRARFRSLRPGCGWDTSERRTKGHTHTPVASPTSRADSSFRKSATLFPSHPPARKLPMELTDPAWPAVAALPRSTPVVFPVAALEQHGRHMPVFTDSLLLGEVVRRVKQTPAADRCLFAPLQWLGNSHHHLDF